MVLKMPSANVKFAAASICSCSQAYINLEQLIKVWRNSKAWAKVNKEREMQRDKEGRMEEDGFDYPGLLIKNSWAKMRRKMQF